ncbi:ComEC family competence protein [Botrimarina colliarenosi]|uniref:ComEC family competence protein n=1 Tax=Botrimarina colliarenosi TaxID=2528001 RepID=A0A5C6AHX0_9BACT|nr:ComEC/Rec2 family competence protein [Botrimarina colliarenosi]TWT99632.1 ComEC family competence protein [Botrimarina colliarenosi]
MPASPPAAAPSQPAPSRPTPSRRAAEQRLAARRQQPARPADTPLVWTAAAVALGAVVAPLLAGLPAEAAMAPALVALASWGFAWRRRTNHLAVGWLLAAVALSSAAWSGAAWRLFAVDDLGRSAPRDAEPVCLEAIAVTAPVHYPAAAPTPFRAIPSTDRTVIEVEANRLRDAESWRATSGRCEVTIAGRVEDIAPGDRLTVFGQLRQPHPALNPGERDAAAAERSERRLATVWCASPACVTRRGGGAPRPVSRTLAGVRNSAIQSIDQRLSPRAAPLVRAMLLGDASGLSDEDYDVFRRTGTVHLLVVSGLHVGLVAAAPIALAALGLLPRRSAWALSLVLVTGYVALVGARPPALRAGIVASSICVAALAGRRPISANSLAAAAIVVFAVAPGAWAAAGTRLSFLSAATLLGVAGFAAKRRAAWTPPLERLVRSTRSPRERIARGAAGWAVWGVGATLAVQLVTGPLVASEFHLVSPAAAPLSLCVSPLLMLLIGGGLATLFAEMLNGLWGVFGPLADGAAGVSSLATNALSDAIEFGAASPGAGFWTGGPAPWWVAAWTGWVALAAASGAYWPRAAGAVWRLGLALVAAAFVPTLWEAATASDELRCSFIAVGHGSSTLIETPGGGAVLVDAGALTAPERVADVIARALWARGVHRLDAVVLTHPDTDHYNAVPGLLERMPIRAVLTTTLMFPSWDDPQDASGPAELSRRLATAGIPVRSVQLGDRWRVGRAEFEVLHPDDIGVVGSDNANSLVLGIEHAGRRVLLPGDLESPGIELLLAQEPYDCDVLLAPHHGSRRSDPAGFAAWCRPEQVVVSSGEPRNAAGLSYMAAGARVWSTHQVGLVTTSISRGGVRVAAFTP